MGRKGKGGEEGEKVTSTDFFFRFYELCEIREKVFSPGTGAGPVPFP